MTDRRDTVWARLGPPHIGVMFGLSTAAYAVTLAGVSGLQAGSEAALAAERAPAIARVDAIAAGNQRLADELAAVSGSYNTVAARYSAAGGSLADLEAALGNLATRVERIDGVSRSLPSKIALPAVSRVSSGGGGGGPSTSSTTGASGG